MVLSALPLMIVFPSGLNAMLITEPVCPDSVRICVPVCVCHRQMVSSSTATCDYVSIRAKRDADNRHHPYTPIACVYVRLCPHPIDGWFCPLLPLAIVCPSGLNETLLTNPSYAPIACGYVVACGHIPQTDGIVPTATNDCVSIRAKRDADRPQPLCPDSVRRCLPSCVFHRPMVSKLLRVTAIHTGTCDCVSIRAKRDTDNRTPMLRPNSVRRCSPVCAFHRWML